MKETKIETNKLVFSSPSKLLSIQSKFLIKHLGILLLTILLLASSLYYGIGKVKSIKTKISESQKSEKLLNNKVSILRNVTSTLPEDISYIDFALPSKGIALYAISQVKNQANTLGLLISNLRTGSVSEDKNGISKINLTFDVEGYEQSIYDYLGLFPKMLPLMKIDKLSINTTAGIATATVSVSAYSGDLPKSIPSLTSPIKDLTNEEIQTLNNISEFLKPEFVTLSASTESPKEDPFN